jgi:type IX secretion system PorP/SprF family membrane protein
MKKVYIFLFVICAAFGAKAQQWPQYTLYSWNPLAFNPAYAGMDGSLSFTGALRKQWVRLEGSPFSQAASVHLPIELMSSGFGLTVGVDQLGAERTSDIGLAYSYRMELGNGALLSLGVQGLWMQYTLDGTLLRTPDGNYEGGGVNHLDGVLPEGRFNAATASYGVGAFLDHSLGRVGLSMQHAMAPVLTPDEPVFSVDRVFTGFLETKVRMGRSWQWIPSVLAKSNGAQTQVDWTNIFSYEGNFYIGMAFRGYDRPSVDAAAAIAGIRLNEKFFLGYGYDFPLSSLRRANDGSHEVVLRYNLRKPIGQKRIPPIIYSPRF